jgi:uncharacterized protein YndB with AHSA1/START domain
MIAFHTDVRIERPIGVVFDYVADPRHFPAWNSAVETVRATSTPTPDVGAVYAMERRLPGGPASNKLEIIARRSPAEFAVEASAGPTPFRYRYRLEADGTATTIRLDAEVEVAGFATLAPHLARRVVRSGVDSNLATLKRLLETR